MVSALVGSRCTLAMAPLRWRICRLFGVWGSSTTGTYWNGRALLAGYFYEGVFIDDDAVYNDESQCPLA